MVSFSPDPVTLQAALAFSKDMEAIQRSCSVIFESREFAQNKDSRSLFYGRIAPHCYDLGEDMVGVSGKSPRAL